MCQINGIEIAKETILYLIYLYSTVPCVTTKRQSTLELHFIRP